MRDTSVPVAVGGLLLAVVLGGCGGGSSSTTSSSRAPTDAPTDAFCATFGTLGDDMTPKTAAERLAAVGTPSGVSAAVRHGFQVLVDNLAKLPDTSTATMLTEMTAGLKAGDHADVLALLRYYTDTCQASPTGSSS